MKPALTLVGQTSLQPCCRRTYVQIPPACLQENQVYDLQHKTQVLTPSNPQSPKPHPPPTAGAYTHMRTDTLSASTLPAFNSCSLTNPMV